MTGILDPFSPACLSLFKPSVFSLLLLRYKVACFIRLYISKKSINAGSKAIARV